MSLKNKDRVSKGHIVDEMHRFNILLESREVFLHAYIDNVDDDPGVEYRMSNNFVKNMALLSRIDSSKPIVVHQHSVGGYWCEGMMMYDAIASCPAPVVVITHGIAASMGSIVPQAGDLRISMPNCWWLIHHGTTDISPDFTIKMAKSWHEWEERTGKQMMEIYADMCSVGPEFKGKTESQIKNYITKQFDKKEDWWLTSEEAVAYGFVDAMYGTRGYESLDDIKSHVC